MTYLNEPTEVMNRLRDSIISGNLISTKVLLKEVHQDKLLKKYFEEEFFTHFINHTMKSPIALDILLDFSENYLTDLSSLFGLIVFIKKSSVIDEQCIDKIITSFKIEPAELKRQAAIRVFILRTLYAKPLIYDVLKKHNFTSDLSPKEHLEIVKLYREYSPASFLNENFFHSYFHEYPLKATTFFIHSFIKNLDIDSSTFKNHQFIFNLILSTYQLLSVKDRQKVFNTNEKHILDENFPPEFIEHSLQELDKIKAMLSKIDLYEQLKNETDDTSKNNLLRQKL